MDAFRSRRISKVFRTAQAREGDERRAFLDAACAGDEALRGEVEALLSRDEGAYAFATAATVEARIVPAASDGEAVRPGQTFGRYRIERLLGRGGMGAVFLAHDGTLRRWVALKVVEGAANGETARTRLLREARNAAALNHPNICTIHEVVDADDSAFIAMEYVEGRALSDRLAEGPLPFQEALRYAIQAAGALDYAHAHGVVHRDFKAANAIVTETGGLKVVDFGLARRGDALMLDGTTNVSLVPAGAAAGTPYAMAPEQVRGEGTDGRADLWALGVLLYEMVSGAKPFAGDTVPELFSAILRDAPAPLPDALPFELRSVIARLLEKDPKSRYQRAGEVKTALEAIESGAVKISISGRARLGWRRVASVAAGLGIAALVAGWNDDLREWLGDGPAEPVPIRLAVLPFDNLTGDPEQEYFSDGLTEEVITQLGRLQPQRLSVIARTSSMRYKNSDAPIDRIGRELGVDFVLEGSARREGSRVRINATLVQVRDQTQRWAQSFDRDLAGVLTLQSDVARGVAGALALNLLPAEQSRLVYAGTVNPEAYEAYLRGISHVERTTQSSLETALQYFDLALKKDPLYALAYMGIRRVWAVRRQAGFASPAESTREMEAALSRALELDDALPEAHYSQAAQYAWTDWDWPAAEASFRRAIDLSPNYAQARALYSHYLHLMKRPEEAMAQIEQAMKLDPFNSLVQSLYGGSLLMDRRNDEALEQFRSALRTEPGSLRALHGIASSLHSLGRYEEEVAAERAYWTARGDSEIDEALALGHAEGGYPGAMRRSADTLASRSRGRNTNHLDVATFYLYAGAEDEALDWLERSYEARDANLPYISSGQNFDAVRDEPRFQDLLRRMNLPR